MLLKLNDNTFICVNFVVNLCCMLLFLKFAGARACPRVRGYLRIAGTGTVPLRCSCSGSTLKWGSIGELEAELRNAVICGWS